MHPNTTPPPSADANADLLHFIDVMLANSEAEERRFASHTAEAEERAFQRRHGMTRAMHEMRIARLAAQEAAADASAAEAARKRLDIHDPSNREHLQNLSAALLSAATAATAANNSKARAWSAEGSLRHVSAACSIIRRAWKLEAGGYVNRRDAEMLRTVPMSLTLALGHGLGLVPALQRAARCVGVPKSVRATVDEELTELQRLVNERAVPAIAKAHLRVRDWQGCFEEAGSGAQSLVFDALGVTSCTLMALFNIARVHVPRAFPSAPFAVQELHHEFIATWEATSSSR